jgi:LmbE family N-acetylglucosaminyl deacetylase
MRQLGIARPGERLSVLCLGAHSDDIEIGAGATIRGWIESGVRLDVYWVVLSAAGERGAEARASATQFLEGTESAEIELGEFRDGFFPYQGAEIKFCFEALRKKVKPDVIFSHWNGDAHQDHRQVSQLTWNTFRNHLILEYEIPKWDGDLGRPNVYVPATRSVMDRKVELLLGHFGTQRSKDWFDSEVFTGLARLRGSECRAPDGLAEAFHVRKLVLQ